MKLLPLTVLLAVLSLTACARAPMTTLHEPAATVAGHAYVVGGHVKGLAGIGLSVRSARGEEVLVEDDGKFVFRTTLEDGAEYAISVGRQPISPAQSCMVERAADRIAGKNAMETTIVCTNVTFEDFSTPTAVATEASPTPAGGTGETKHASR